MSQNSGLRETPGEGKASGGRERRARHRGAGVVEVSSNDDDPSTERAQGGQRERAGAGCSEATRPEQALTKPHTAWDGLLSRPSLRPGMMSHGSWG